MIIDFYQNLPLHIDPVAFAVGSFAVRWYGLMYLVGFLVVYGLLRLRISKGEFPVSPRWDKLGAKISNFQFSISNKIPKSKYQISNKGAGSNVKCFAPSLSSGQLSNVLLDYLLVAFFSALVGGRLGYVLFYNFQYYFANPLAIISPYDFQSGKYAGIFGMSYHGALLGIIIGSWFFLKKRKINFLAWADFVIPAATLGYFFGRIGNFLNGELYGRITSSPLGMYFGADQAHLRHPSQLYEALLEGLLLGVILWKMQSASWRKNSNSGTLFGIYLMGYGLLRFFVEQFRQPDPQLGLLWNYFTMGQILSSIMILIGLLILISKKGK